MVIQKVGIGEGAVGTLPRPVEEEDELFGRFDGHGAKEDGVHDREHRDRGSDSEGERRSGGQYQRRARAAKPQPVAQVLKYQSSIVLSFERDRPGDGQFIELAVSREPYQR